MHEHVEILFCIWQYRYRQNFLMKAFWSVTSWKQKAEESCNRPVGRVATRSSLEREVWASNLGPVKSDTVLTTARNCYISLKEVVLPRHNDSEMGPANSLHASAYHSEYNKRFDIKFRIRQHKVVTLVSRAGFEIMIDKLWGLIYVLA